MKTQAIVDYYRCPESLADFFVVEDLSGESGYFRFGIDTICFGQCSFGVPAVHPLDASLDVAQDLVFDGSSVRLPFDPTQIINNLRFERYINRSQDGRKLVGSRSVRNIYYLVRPLLPVAVRKWLQRSYLRDWRKIPFPTWPVDFTVERVCGNLLRLLLQTSAVDRIPFIWFWPEGHSSCVVMTHDVETSSGLSFCNTLMDINDSFTIKASFQLVPEERYVVSRKVLVSMRNRGFEVNVHDLNHDGHLFDERNQFLQRVRRINEYADKFGAKGFRAGALYRNVDWYEALAFSYDMSVPNIGHLDPQRGGCCTVLPYFIGGVLELPLTTTQDYSLFHILGDYSIDLWKTQIHSILEKNGLISFVIHPDYIIEQRARNTYKALLGYLAELRSRKRIWMALPGEVDTWWRQRSQMKIVPDGDTWRIEGEGKERARVAYAALSSGRLRVELEEASW